MKTPTPRSGSLSSVEDVLRDVGFEIPELTEEQWAERDRQVAAARAEEARRAETQRIEGRRRDLRAAGFPLRAIDSAMVADATAAPIVRVASWDPSKASTLVISGSKGCGKTVAATWWAMHQPTVPRFIRAATFAASSRYERADRNELLEAPALVLDDLGTEYLDAKGSFLVDLDELMDVFYGDCKPLLITTNSSLEDFRTRVGERFADRMRECAVFWATSARSLRRQR